MIEARWLDTFNHHVYGDNNDSVNHLADFLTYTSTFFSKVYLRSTLPALLFAFSIDEAMFYTFCQEFHPPYWKLCFV